MKTPIFIDFESTYPQYNATAELGFYTADQVDLYTLESDPMLAMKPYILAPRYFVIIERPKNNPGPKIKMHIHKSPFSILRNQLRVCLDPSIGYGHLASYKVTYYEWRPLLNIEKDITVTKILQEWWYVPTIEENTYVPMFPFDPRIRLPIDIVIVDRFDQPRLVKEKVPVTRVDNTGVDGTVIDTITTREHSHLFNFRTGTFTEDLQPEVFNFNESTLDWTYSKRLVGSSLTRDANTVDGAIIDGSVDTTIEYIKPFHPSQITIKSEHLEMLVR